MYGARVEGGCSDTETGAPISVPAVWQRECFRKLARDCVLIVIERTLIISSALPTGAAAMAWPHGWAHAEHAAEHDGVSVCSAQTCAFAVELFEQVRVAGPPVWAVIQGGKR